MDLRTPALGVCVWLGSLAGLQAGAGPASGGLTGTVVSVALLAVVVLAGAVAWLARRNGSGHPSASVLRTGLVLALVALAAAAVAGFRVHRVGHNPVTELAVRHAAVEVVMSVTSDPRLVSGSYSSQTLVRARVSRVTPVAVTTPAASSGYRLEAPVLVVADPSWSGVRLGSVLVATGRLSPATAPDVAAVLRPFAGPADVAEPAWWWSAADRVRASLRASVAGVPEDRRALVPALVVGDDQGLDPALADDFRTTGLTHLLAVSGTNLTLLVGFLLLVARWCGVRGRWQPALALAGILGFVLLARPEPSVLRAAVMGAVGLAALGGGGTRRGGRSLGAAVTGLLLVDPWLAPTPGFALSVLATAGIVFLAPAWRDALAAWLPRGVADAVAVPAAAQLACTPVVAALSGQVSLVAVLANLVAAPAVGPATVLGLAGGLAGLVWAPLGAACGTLAGWCVAVIVAVARHGAALPNPAVGWGSGPVALVALTALCLAAAVAAPRLLRRRAAGATCGALVLLVAVVRPPSPGWPPDGWVLAICDVGQGDAIALRAADGSAVVVDAGPDPALVDRCLRRLDVREVPLLVLTHYHRDHVDGIEGVARGRAVGAIEVTPLADPPEGVEEVSAVAARLGLPVRAASYDSVVRVGDVVLQVLWPLPSQPVTGPGDGSTANNASVVLLARVRGVSVLLTGDVEPPGQEALARIVPGLHVDVLKVPHHGSRFQDLPFLTSLEARLALVSVGADNDYGHPAAETLTALEQAGTPVLRTDLDGDLVVATRSGRLVTVTAR